MAAPSTHSPLLGDPPGTFRLGDHHLVEPRLHRLTGPEGPVRMEPKVLAVLVELAREPRRVVSQEELRERVWGTPHVSDEVVRRAVYELRKALGEDASDPRFIETVPRAGYRLIARVEPAAPEEELPFSRRKQLAAAVVAAALGAGALVLLLAVILRPHGEAPAPAAAAAEPAVRPLTAYPGLEYDPAFSPDGRRVAFIRAAPDGSDPTLHVQAVVGERALRIAGAAESPCWSTDGERIVFARKVEEPDGVDRYELREVSALGGPARLLAEMGEREPYGLACSPDGRHLAFGWSEAPEEPYRLMLLDRATGEWRPLTEPPAGISGDGAPAFSPDGSEVAFLRNTYSLIQDIHVVPTAGGAARRMTPESRKIPSVSWSPDGKHLLFSRYGGGDHRLWRVPAAGGEPEPVGVGEGAMDVVSDPAGGRVVYSRYTWRWRFWRVDLDTGRAEPLPLLSSSRFDSEVAISPDGSRLAFTSTRSGDFEIWVSGADLKDPRRLTDFGGPTTGLPAWSPDGRWIAFASAAGGDADVWRIDVRGGLPERLTSGPSQEVAPWWSRDGRWLYYASNRTGRWELWRKPAAAGGDPAGSEANEGLAAARRVTRKGGHLGADSPDGRWLYFTRRGEPGLWRRPLAEEEVDATAEQVLENLPSYLDGNWALTGDGVLFVAKADDGHTELRLLDPDTGEESRLHPLEDWPMNRSLAVSPDGTWVVYSQAYGVDSDLVLAEGVF